MKYLRVFWCRLWHGEHDWEVVSERFGKDAGAKPGEYAWERTSRCRRCEYTQ